ncbi:hypothetical protein ACE3MZ_14310 [Paenibacillus sp. WLX1005]|uniref:hypothetical protein n=1 Tax=unclassified Paenibacillus TaxID=185978 RepID=UPI003983F65E
MQQGERRIALWLMGIGGFVALLFLQTLLPDPLEHIGVLWWGIIPAAIGCVLLHSSKRKQQQWMERQVLRIAAGRNNRFTAADVSLFTSLTLSQAGYVLEDMRRKGLLRLFIAEHGEFVYEFKDLLSPEQKSMAAPF